MANWIIRGRQVITLLTNESGGGVVEGDVVIIDDGDANSFTTTAVEGQSDECIGVAIETIVAAAEGRICIGGEVAQVNLDGAAVLRDWIKCDGVVKQATPQAAPGTGVFGQVLAAGATPAAIIWTHPLQPAGGGGDSTYTDTFANEPAASNDGDLLLPSDGFFIERDTGAAWIPWGPIFPFIAPVDGDYAWVNQGGASVDATKGGILLHDPANAADNWRIRVKAIPGVPYVITAYCVPLTQGGGQIGIGFRESGTGRLHFFIMVAAGGGSVGTRLISSKYTDPTTFSAAYLTTDFGIPIPGYVPFFLQIADDNSNRILSFSRDGQNFVDFHTIGRTDFLTADQVFFCAQAADAGALCSNLLLHWKET